MARRMRGEGSVYERKDGYWVAQYKGRYRYAKTKKEAKRKLLELLKAGEVHMPHGTTVAVLMDRRIDFAQQDLKPATIKRYREAVEIYVKPSLGDKKLHKVDAITVQEMYASMLRNGLSPATVNLVHSDLSSTFKRAIKWGVLHHNVIESVEAPKILRGEVDVFTHTSRGPRVALSDVWGPFGSSVYPCFEYGDAWGEILGLELTCSLKTGPANLGGKTGPLTWNPSYSEVA